MGVYEFKCESCNKITVKSLPITSNQKKTKCDFCGKVAKKTISNSFFNLRGSGWAKDGYSKKENK